MNLRKDHYRIRALAAQPPTLVSIHLLLWRAHRGHPVAGGRRPRPAPAEAPCEPCMKMGCLSTMKIVKTFNNGSLGSGIDEERSEMR